MKTQIEECNNEKIWNQALKKHGCIPFFFSWKWKNVLQKTYPWMKPHYYIYKDSILPGFSYKKTYLSIPFCEYGGIISNKKEEKEELLKKLKNDFKDKKIILKNNSVDNESSENLLLHRSKKLVTYINDLKKSEKELFSKLRKTTRHSIGYAQKDGVKVKEISNKKEIKKFYDIYLSTIKKNKGVPQPKILFDEIYKLQKTNDALILISELKGTILSGIVLLFNKTYASYYISANSKDAYKYHANHLIIWKAILSAKKRGMEKFDFGAAMTGSAGETFKRGWGGERKILFKDSNVLDETPKKSGLARKMLGIIPKTAMKVSVQTLNKKAFDYM